MLQLHAITHLRGFNQLIESYNPRYHLASRLLASELSTLSPILTACYCR
jgi:hypothetical protein